MIVRTTMLLIALFHGAVDSYSVESSRRDFVKGIFVASTLAFDPPQNAHAIDACPKGSKNCIRTTWTPPSGSSKDSAVKDILRVLKSYPQEGQNGVDLGGFSVTNESGSPITVEYKSGIGNFAKYFNKGQPFVDDIVVEVSTEAVEVRSSSRIGESDFDVNRKRLVYLGDALRSAGWTISEPKY